MANALNPPPVNDPFDLQNRPSQSWLRWVNALYTLVNDMAIDPASQCMAVIDSPHHEIHAGRLFSYSDAVTLGNGVSQDYVIVTPATGPACHLEIAADGVGVTSFSLYEGTDKTPTTLQAPWNRNRLSSTVNTTLVYKGDSAGTTDGTLLSTYSSGTATNQSRSASNVDFSHEVILKMNTKYIFRVTSGTAANLCNVQFDWYELTYGTF